MKASEQIECAHRKSSRLVCLFSVLVIGTFCAALFFPDIDGVLLSFAMNLWFFGLVFNVTKVSVYGEIGLAVKRLEEPAGAPSSPTTFPASGSVVAPFAPPAHASGGPLGPYAYYPVPGSAV